jgi:hypothetical protein
MKERGGREGARRTNADETLKVVEGERRETHTKLF